jgi:uncharacterized FAD-dependent dehydrogenase
MRHEIDLIVSPQEASDIKNILPLAIKKAGVKEADIASSKIIRRSIDARSKTGNIRVNLRVLLILKGDDTKQEEINFNYQDVSSKEEIIVVGAGPAGLYASLRLIELGFKPVILERGKEISERKQDIANIHKTLQVDPESNYAFGEGGAGTFSDGKLYTRSKKKGNNKRALEILRFHGATEDILIDAHPHIGSDKLPTIISNIRNTIINSGGVVKFNTRVDDLIIEKDCIKGVITNEGEKLMSRAVILATGHSARDIYEMLHNKEIELEAKSFAMGVRIEHPQGLIDSIQYHSKGTRSEFLPAATYNVAKQIKDRGVYSFCMCPGGFIVPASTANNEMVVNGMSPSHRNSPFANSGMVVEIRTEDCKEFSKYGVLAGLKYQQQLEQLAFTNGGEGIVAPAQRVNDFVNGRVSPKLPETSYIPGIVSSPMHKWLPQDICKRLQMGIKSIGDQMRGYLTNDAIIVGVESRTSSPVRIPRNWENLQHTQIKGLYPCGEGAGYAGGIISSAIDGEKCAEMIGL